MTENNEARQPDEVLPPREPQRPQQNSLATFAQNIGDVIHQITTNSGLSFTSSAREIEYDDLAPNQKAIVDAVIEKLTPDIEEKAVNLLKLEIRDRLVKRGEWANLERLLKKGKVPKIKRKKGCIFLQFGTGEPDDPIDEFMIAST